MTTDLGFSYELDLDIDLAYPASDTPNWQAIRFTSAVAPQSAPTLLDAATYDDEGAANQVRVGETDTLGFTIQIQRDGAGAYLPEVQKLLDAAAPGLRGKAAQVHVRYYDSEGSDYAREGRFTVQADRQNTGNAEVGGWSITLTSAGPVQKIAVPVAAPATKPTLTSATPSAVAQGGQVTIKGSGFTGTIPTSGVKFGATNATSWVVVGDSTIVAIMPAGTAGAANTVVTNAAGASDALPYTRGA
ncbi:hypothetical protein CWIS_13575, partial [Cellulomonas sp. A375-1]